MSLLQTETVNLLGIGTGGVQDFATGIRSRRKQLADYNPQQLSAQDRANMTENSRLIGKGAQKLTYNPKADPASASRFQLNTNDKKFIEAVQSLQSRVNTLSDPKGLTDTDTRQIKEEYARVAQLAGTVSKGDGQVANSFNELSSWLEGQNYLSAPNFVELQDKFGRATSKINKYLDTGIDTATFTFLDAPKPTVKPKKTKRTVSFNNQLTSRETMGNFGFGGRLAIR